MIDEIDALSLDGDSVTVSSQFDRRFGRRVLKKKDRARVMKRRVHPDYIKQINKIIRGGK